MTMHFYMVFANLCPSLSPVPDPRSVAVHNQLDAIHLLTTN